MSWELSQYRVGDRVEVLSADEILATLDEQGCVDGMPFMPEMLQYCGKAFVVRAVAHKACETALKTWQGRRLERAVHLQDLRCDGSFHGGCQADCSLYFKDVWLKPAKKATSAEQAARGTSHSASAASGCTLDKLHSLTQLPILEPDAPVRYSCQTTKLYDATKPLSPYNPRQYLRDWWTGNHTLGHALGELWISFLESWHPRTPLGYRWLKSHLEAIHRRVTGRPRVEIHPQIPQGQRTPSQSLGLKPGEYVRVKSIEEITATLGAPSHNRGHSFDYEMAAYCGRVLRVKRVVTQILNEETGEMMQMKNACITLEGAYCGGEYSACRLLCPRQLPPYWREIWLERAPAPASEEQVQDDAANVAEDQHAVA